MISNEENHEDSMIGRRVGVYELKREIGRGGMGAVYLAERVDGEFRQTVAIKLIKRGMDTDLILKRFRRERQIIAALDHPNITYFLAGGSTEDGLPYFVMEYIDGESLYKFCDENRLSIEERLKIFRQICDAVETAHKNKVIHRDLKPSNILVKKDGTPKLLDFGIAKVLDPDLAVTDIDPTATAMRVMTPEYASPEQVTGSEITPVSDVYSLGIILYELLTGHRPYKLKRRVPHEVARIICEEEPLTPSDAVTRRHGDTAIEKIDEQKLPASPALRVAASKLKGDLDRIVLKTLRKNPAERYQSAAALAGDITNFLENRPVNAEVFLPEAIVRKNASDRKSVAILPFKLIGAETSETTEDIFLGVGLTDALISRLSGVKRLIFRPTSTVLRFSERDDSLAVGHELSVDFVVDGTIRRVGERLRVTAQLLSVEDNSTVWSESFDEKSTDVLELEDSLSEKIAKSLLPKLTGEEEKQLNKRGTNNADAYDAYLRGRVNWNLQTEQGFSRAINFYQRAVELDPEYALAYAAIAEYYMFLGIHCVIPFEQGSVAAKQAAEQAVRLDPTLAEGHAALGFAALAFDLDWKKAFDRISRAIEINPNSHQSHFWRAAMLAQTKQFDLAIGELKILNELDPDSLLNLHMHAWVFYHARRFDESIGMYRQILKIEPNYTWGMLSYSWALRQVGEFDEAIRQAERAVQLTGETPFYLTNLAATYADAGERGKAKELLAHILEIGETRFVSEYMLALVYCALGDKDKAFENLEKSLRTHDSWINWLGVEPQFDRLRDDPRYDDLMRRAGNPLTKRESSNTDAAKPLEKKSIAVLPLKVTSAGNFRNAEEDEFLGIGLADALITRLSNMQRLIVRPTSSVLQFAGLNPLDAGEHADVDFILSGSIKKSGERIRVTVQLLNVGHASTVWAENFDEKYTDVLELEDSISDKVTRSILPKLTGEEKRRLGKRGTNSHEAYEAYMRARFYWNQFTHDSFPKTIAAFEKAVAIDPDYALAHAALADTYHWSGIYSLSPTLEYAPKVYAAANRALELDPTLGEAYAALGMYYSCLFDYRKSDEMYRRAIELAPNDSLAHVLRGSDLIGAGNFDKGLKECEIAERLDPVSLIIKALSAWAHYQARRFEEAYRKGKEIVALDPNYPQGWIQIGNAALELGFIKEAVESCGKAVELMKPSPLPVYTFCFALARDGQTEKARRIIRELIEQSKSSYVTSYFLGMVHVAIGEIETAFGYFEKAFEEKSHWLLWFGTDAKLDVIRSDERYFRLFGRMNNPLIEKQRAKIKTAEKNAEKKKSIAVLPFKMTGSGDAKNTDEVFLGIGLADALVSRLSGVQRLIVRPTSSVLPFAEKNPIDAGNIIGVNFVLDGTIRRVGERIRITVQLLNVAEGATVWAEKFDENFTDVLELEDVISEKVAKALLPRLTGEEKRRLEKRGTNKPKAYQAYLRGRYFANQFSGESLLKSIEFYEQAVGLDPDYALPHIGIADFYIWSVIFGEIPSKEGFPKARQAIENALKIDDRLGEAYALSAFISLLYDWNWSESERLIKRALELNPNYYFAHEAYSAFLVSQGIFEQGREEIVRAEELDPLSPRGKLMTSWTFYQTREFPKALEKARQANEMQKDFAQGLLHLGNTLAPNGRTKEAVEVLKKSLAFWGESGMPLYMLCFALVEDGRIDEAREVLNQILEIAERRFMMPYYIAAAYTAVGDFDNAFKWFEKAVEDKNVWLIWFGTEPKFDEFRKDARYLEILKRTNNPLAARIETGETTGETAQKSIAVLPFKIITSGNTGENEEDEYLSIGLADALTMRLSNVRRFLVRPTSSVLTFGSPDTEPFFAGRELGVDFVIDGNIRRVGNRIRVAAQLLNVGENSTRWAERFDEKYTDVLELEDSISERVTESLLPKLTGEEKRRLHKRGTNSPEAFDAFMQARFYWNQFTPETFPKVLESLEKAVALDPDYAPAYAGIADFYNWATILGFYPNSIAAPKVYAAAHRALEIDDSLAEAYAALGLYYSSLLDYEKSQANYRRAIELKPNYSLAHEWYGSNLVGLGFFDEGVRECELAEQLDPFSLRAKTLTAWTKYQAGKFDAAYEKGKEMLALDPNYPQCYLQIGNAALELGLVEEALETTAKAAELMKPSPVAVYPYCFALVRAGQTEKAREIVRELVAQSRTTFVTPYFLAMAHVAVGEIDEAFRYFKESFEIKDHWLLWFGTDAKLDAIRTDERYFELFKVADNPLIEKQTAIITTSEKNTEKKKSVAVLPFRVIGENSEDEEYLSLGLADAIITKLSNVRRLVVRPTSSILRFEAITFDPFQAGHELSVESVLEGTIRRVGERIRVSVKLLSVKDDSVIWAENLDENFTDVLELEDSISGRVARSLIPELTGEEREQLQKRGTNNPAAYEAYMRGRYLANQFTNDAIAKSLAAFEDAIKIDPDYALPRVGIAEFYVWSSVFGAFSSHDAYPKAKAELRRALEIDDQLAEAYALSSFVTLLYDWDWKQAENLVKKALAINPNYSFAHNAYAHVFASQGVEEKAMREIKLAETLDPLSPLAKVMTSCISYQVHRFDEASASARNASEMQMEFPQGFLHLGNSLTHNGGAAEAVKVLTTLCGLWENSALPKFMLCFALAENGQIEKAKQVLEQSLKIAETEFVKPYFIAMAYTAVGEVDGAFEYFSKAIETRDEWMIWFGTDIKLEVLRTDPRYYEILKQTNNPIITKHQK